MRRRVVGILGGKGPEATSQLFQLIVDNTPTAKEEDHLRVIIDCNPQIPKPALAIAGQGENPVAALTETAQNLVRAGADFIVIPCNSAHYYIESIRASITVPVLSLGDEAVKAVQESACTRIGLMASTGLLASGYYQALLGRGGVEYVIPGAELQRRLMESILEFKDSGAIDRLRAESAEVCRALLALGADGLLLACTELPLALSGERFSVPVLDTLEILALAAIREATSEGVNQ